MGRIRKTDEVLKQWTIRVPADLLDWYRTQAAKETISRGVSISMNEYLVEILRDFRRGMEE